MEAAPLTLAQTHARNAALETKRANPVAASEEHDLAAAEFAAAAQLTKDNEALRMLNLLEQHHKRLGQILKSQHTMKSQETSPDVTPEQDPVKTTSSPTRDTHRSTSPETTSQPPRLVRTGRPTARDLSSSIASNLASARGIPSHRPKRSTPISPLVSNQYADGLFSQDDDAKTATSTRPGSQAQSGRAVSLSSHRPSWAPPADVTEPNTSTTTSPDPTASDAPFQQFYSTFESLMSKLSAPLAFAGLPLTSPNPPPTISEPSAAKTRPAKPMPPPSKPLESSLDYSQLISRAALRAVSRNDKSSSHGNPAESFYVVPTTGGTTTYADIMTRADREASHHRRNLSNLSTGTADSFEDASSTILPPLPPEPPSRPGLSNELKFNGKTMEELSLENKALKHLSDTLSKRLHVFEMSAQSSSAALAQSIRSLHLSPLTTPENSRGKAITMTGLNIDSPHGGTYSNSSNAENLRLKSRINELESILQKSDAKIQKRDDENAKLRDKLTKNKEKFETLKAGAKARMERVAGETAGTGSGATGAVKVRERREKPREGGRDRDREGSDAGTTTRSGTGTEKDDANPVRTTT